MSTKSRATVTHDALFDTAADVARRLRAFDEYGSEARATRALRRRCPGFGETEYVQALSAALKLFDAACSLATERAGEFQGLQQPTDADWEPYAHRLALQHPGFAESTCRWVTGWAIYYFALR